MNLDHTTALAFEKPVLEMEEKIQELMRLSETSPMDFQDEIHRLRQQAQDVKQKIYQNLQPFQRLQIARHPHRPNFLEVIQLISPNVWIELRGDRSGMDDRAMIGGIAEVNSQPIIAIGTQKGRGMKENLTHNFGMAHPEGYRKALRLFQHAEKFQMPVVTFIDTPGAYPGMDSEEHGIGHAIAWNIREMARLTVPIISVVLGEASSGGALGIGVADRIFMLEHAQYTVISPEGCASILWRSAEHAERAVEALKISAMDLESFGMIEGIIPEPLGGAHKDPQALGQSLIQTLDRALTELQALSVDKRLTQRYERFRRIGAFEENPTEAGTKA